MARLTTNYRFNISEGNDPVNPLVDIFPNWEALDSDLKGVSDASIGIATELTTGTVHALSRSDTDKNVFVFIATSNFTAGDTFTLDGNQVSALTPDGQTLASGSYVIGSTVLCALHDTLITLYVSPAKAKDSDMLDGHDSTYYAKDSDLDTLGNTVNSISDKVGSAVLSTTAPDLSGAVNELHNDFNTINRDRVVKYKEYQVSFSGAQATINMANDGILGVRVLDVTHNRSSGTGYTIQFIPSPQVATDNPYVITVVRQRWNSGTPVGVTTSETITLRVNYY